MPMRGRQEEAAGRREEGGRREGGGRNGAKVVGGFTFSPDAGGPLIV